MDLEMIKKIIEKEKGKVIIVENGKPILVISSFDVDFQDKNSDKNVSETNNPSKVEKKNTSNSSIPLPEKMPQNETLLSEGNQKEKKFGEEESEEITLDDLPL